MAVTHSPILHCCVSSNKHRLDIVVIAHFHVAMNDRENMTVIYVNSNVRLFGCVRVLGPCIIIYCL